MKGYREQLKSNLYALPRIEERKEQQETVYGFVFQFEEWSWRIKMKIKGMNIGK